MSSSRRVKKELDRRPQSANHRRFMELGPGPVGLGGGLGSRRVARGSKITGRADMSVDIRCDVLPPYLRYRRVFANLSEVPPVALFR